MNEVDPIEFGRLQATVEAQGKQLEAMTAMMAAMRADIHKLTSIAERGKGALWLALTVGGVLGWLINHLGGK